MQNINFHTCIKIENKLWFITIDGYLMNYDFKLNEVKVIVPQNLKDLHFKQIVDDMIYYKDCIYFVEQDASLLYEYNIENNYCFYYKLPEFAMVNWECFSGIYRIDNYIYFFGKTANKICCFNTVNKEISVLKSNKDIVGNNSVKIGQNIYFASENKVIVYNLPEGKYVKEFEINIDIKRIFNYQNEIYILTKQNDIFLYDNSFKTQSIIYSNDTIQTTVCIVVTENKIFVFPSTQGTIKSINKKNGDIKEIAKPLDMNFYNIEWAKFYKYCDDGNTFWLANRMSNYTVCVNKKDESIQFIKIKCGTASQRIPYLKEKELLYNSDLNLEEFLTLYI